MERIRVRNLQLFAPKIPCSSAFTPLSLLRCEVHGSTQSMFCYARSTLALLCFEFLLTPVGYTRAGHDGFVDPILQHMDGLICDLP